jgi:hypothetical protein
MTLFFSLADKGHSRRARQAFPGAPRSHRTEHMELAGVPNRVTAIKLFDRGKKIKNQVSTKGFQHKLQ